MPGKARPRRPAPGAAKKASARKRPGDADAAPGPVLSAEAGPSAKAKAPDEVGLAAVTERSGGDDTGPAWAVPVVMTPPEVADRAVPGEPSGDGDGLPEWAAPDETDVVAEGLWPGAEEPVRGDAPKREWFGGEEAARAACLRLLASAPRTRAQLAAALRRRRVPEEIAESVLARFSEVGLIDDAAFARAWVESRHHGRGLARRALAAELRQRGIAEGEVRAAVGSLGAQDELVAARRLVAKRIAATRGRPLQARVRQLLGMLARKGYPAGLAAQVVREALEQEEPDNSDDRRDLALFRDDSAVGDWL